MQTLFTFFLRYQKIIFLFLTLAFGIFLFFPIHNFQMGLAQGDHGRDLYAFSQTMQGATPYQDYFWTYGPLMPYYYGMIFHLLGSSLQNALLGELILKLLTMIIFYFALTWFIPCLWASLGALWLISFYAHFPHTYNHAGGVCMLTFLLWNIFAYIKTQNKKFIWLGLLCVAILSLIKLNFGITGFIAFFGSWVLIDIAHRTFKKNIGHYLTGSLMTWTVIALAHLWFIRKLPLYYILQCFSLLKSYQQSGYAASTSIAQNTVNFLQGTILSIVSFWPFLILAIIVMIFFLFLITLLVKDEKRSFWRTEAFLALITVVIFMFFSLHEAFLSIMPYARYWAQVFEFSFIFLVIGLMIKKIPRLLQAILAIFFIVLLGFNAVRFHQIIRFFKNPGYHFQLGKNNAYVTNPPSWFATVHQTVSFLNSNLNDKELFFVLPYEPIYYFLANKKSPTREIEFFTFMNTTPEQEQKIILRLEQNNVNYIVLSNRCQSTEAGLGTLGQTYCPLLARYILDNFIAIETFGDWNKPAGWVDNHAVRIFKRKNLPTP